MERKNLFSKLERPGQRRSNLPLLNVELIDNIPNLSYM